MLRDRVELAKHFAEQGFIVGAEIGVESGSFSAEMCKQNPNLKLYCIDMWDLNPSRYEGFRERKYGQAINTLAAYNCEIIKDFSLGAVRRFGDNSLDFVYIDANHSFDHVMQDIIEWGNKVHKGGIISGDDYDTSVGVKLAVDAFAAAHEWGLYLTTDLSKRRSWYIYKGKK